jgi:GT2 family glycosyltransferase
MQNPTEATSQCPVPMGVVVVNYAASRLIEANLPQLERAGAVVVIVDNWSTRAERDAVRTLSVDHCWTLVEMPDNRGFGAGVNAGVRAAEALGCRCFLLLNPDAVVTAETVEQLRAATLADHLALVAPKLVDSQARVVFAGSTLNLRDGRIRSLRSVLASPDPRSRPLTWLTAACLSVHSELWHRAGGFDEAFFMYWEDVDFNLRCLDSGGHVVLRDDLSAIHDQGGSQGPRRGRAKSALYYYFNNRNRLLFGVRHLRDPDLIRWLLCTPRISWETLMRGGRRQLIHSPQSAWAAARGGLAGIVLVIAHLAGGKSLIPQIIRWTTGRRLAAGDDTKGEREHQHRH